MARAEKSRFYIYYDLEESTAYLSDEKMGKLIRAMFGYEKRGELPDFSGDIELETCFRFVKVTMDINNKQYQEKCEQNAENGRKGGRPPKEPTTDSSKKNNSNDEVSTYRGGVELPQSWR